MTRARKLAAAHRLLVRLLARGPVRIATCIARAREVGTLAAAFIGGYLK
jgi:hypothetical protein